MLALKWNWAVLPTVRNTSHVWFDMCRWSIHIIKRDCFTYIGAAATLPTPPPAIAEPQQHDPPHFPEQPLKKFEFQSFLKTPPCKILFENFCLK